MAIGFSWVIINLEKVWLTAIGLCLLGASVIQNTLQINYILSTVSSIGHSYSFWAELTFPIGESISWGLLQVIASIIGTGITLLVNVWIGKYGGYSIFAILGFFLLIGVLSSICIAENLKQSHQNLRVSVYSFGSIILLPEEDLKVCNFFQIFWLAFLFADLIIVK